MSPLQCPAAAADAVVVDQTRCGERDRQPLELARVLQVAVVRRRKVRLGYRNRAGERTVRLVDPWRLADKDDVWHLIAGTTAGQRTFRIDGITDADVTDLVADRPVDFGPAGAWERVVEYSSSAGR